MRGTTHGEGAGAPACWASRRIGVHLDASDAECDNLAPHGVFTKICISLVHRGNTLISIHPSVCDVPLVVCFVFVPGGSGVF